MALCGFAKEIDVKSIIVREIVDEVIADLKNRGIKPTIDQKFIDMIFQLYDNEPDIDNINFFSLLFVLKLKYIHEREDLYNICSALDSLILANLGLKDNDMKRNIKKYVKNIIDLLRRVK